MNDNVAEEIQALRVVPQPVDNGAIVFASYFCLEKQTVAKHECPIHFNETLGRRILNAFHTLPVSIA